MKKTLHYCLLSRDFHSDHMALHCFAQKDGGNKDKPLYCNVS